MRAHRPVSRISLYDWLLVESIRHGEERSGRLPDEAAVAVGRRCGGSLEQRLVARSRALPPAAPLRADIERLLGLFAGAAYGLVFIGLISGVVAARSVIADRQVDVLLAAAALLIVPTLMLLGWLALMLAAWRRSGSGSALGRLTAAGLRRLGPRLLSSPQAGDLMVAFAGALATPWGRWRLGAISHAFWLAYSAAALATLVVFFSVVQYDLTWGTTLLNDARVVRLVEALAAWPSLLGLMPPADPAWIVAGREGAGELAARAEWSRFLLVVIIAYSLLPRLLAWLTCTALAWYSARHLSLDTTRPGHLRLAAELMADERAPEPSGPPVPDSPSRPRRRRAREAGPGLILAVELENAPGALADLVPGLELLDLGRADDRAGRRAAQAAAERLGRPAAAVVAVCSMLRTPDAGTGGFLERLADAADAPLWLVLAEGGKLKARGGPLEERRADWDALARRIGAAVIVLDLDAPESDKLAKLHRVLDGEEASS